MKKFKETLDFYYLAVEHSHTMSAFHLGTALYFIGKARANIESFSVSKGKSSIFKLSLYSQLSLALSKLEGDVYEILKHFTVDKSYLEFVGFDKEE